MSGGRPSKFQEAYCNEVINHCADGASLTSFAAEIGVARSTINQWMEDYPQFSEAVKKAKAKCAAWWERQARLGACGQGQNINATLCIFGLKNMGADDWADVMKNEHTGKNGASLADEAVNAALRVQERLGRLAGD